MASQRCPKCKSDRVRLGYRPTPPAMKLLFRYNLLCDQCNWEFSGFAIPGTVARKTKKKRGTETPSLHRTIEDPVSEVKDLTEEQSSTLPESTENGENPLETAEVVHRPKHLALVRKKRVRVKLHGS